MATRGSLGVAVRPDRLASTRLRKRLEQVAAIPALVFAKGRLEDLLLSRTKGRFSFSGETAQKDPSGRRWKKRSRHTRNSPGHPILVKSGTLRDSIQIVRSNMRSQVALSSPAGGGFRVGVKAGSPAAAYARAHQYGGTFGRNNKVRLPQRRFLGVGDGDVKAVDRLINQIATEQLFK